MDISFCHAWLSGSKDYKTGVEFYCVHGSNGVLKKLFERGRTKFNQDKLLSEIQVIANHHPEIYLPVTSSGVDKQKKKIDRSTLPDFLKPEFDKLQGLIQTISHWHSRLDLIQNNSDRYDAAKIILDAGEQRRSIFNRIDHFIATGTDLVKNVPVKIAEVKILSEDKELRNLQLKNQLLLLRAQRSKLKNKPTRISDYNKVLEDIDKIEKEIQQ